MKSNFESIKKFFSNTTLFWLVYILFLFVLWPQTAWTVDQMQDPTNPRIQFMGVSATWLAWSLAGAVEVTIAIVTHKLNQHWLAMPRWRLVGLADDATTEQRRQYVRRTRDFAWKRFSYQWFNIYAVMLIISMVISAVANYTHVVEFTNHALKVFQGSEWVIRIYQALFGFCLPGISFVFARVLSTIRESEQEEDPAFVETKTKLKESNETIRQLKREANESEQRASTTIRQLERALDESEQRYKAVGDVVRFLFGTDIELRERIRGIKQSFPRLSQNGIAQIVGCSTSTVNEALVGYVVELPEIVEAMK